MNQKLLAAFFISAIMVAQLINPVYADNPQDDILDSVILSGDVTQLKKLLGESLNVDAANKNGFRPLEIAIRINNIEMVKALIAAGAKVDTIGKKGYQPIHLAASSNINILQALLAAGAKIDAMVAKSSLPESGAQPLHFAARSGNAEVVKFLIAAGANVNAKDNNGITPFSYIRTKGYQLGNPELVKETLLAAGAKETPSLLNDSDSNLFEISDPNDCFVHPWKGLIGKTPVMMEFVKEYSSDDTYTLLGKYYYHTSAIDLLLKKDEATPNQWKEFDQNNNLTGLLHLTCTVNTLSGEWKSPDGKKSFNIRAEIAESYSEPRQNALKATVFKRVRIGTNEYEIIIDERAHKGNALVEGVRLLGNSKELLKINKVLLDGFKDDVDTAVSCAEDGMEYSRLSKVIFWNDDFVVIYKESGDDCSGATHSNSFSGYTTYNLLSGDKEVLSKWLTSPLRHGINHDSGLAKILSRAYRKIRGNDEEVQNYLEYCTFFLNWPTDDGLTFTSILASSNYWAVGMENITIPYNILWPYLSPLGQSHAKSFLWNEAQKSDTVNAYEVYLDAFPQGKYAPLAKERIQKLKETIQPIPGHQKQEPGSTNVQQEDNYVSHHYVNAYYNLFPVNPDLAGAGEISEKIRLRNEKLKGIVAAKENVRDPMMVGIPEKKYEIGKYEVTQEEWREVMGSDPGYFIKCGDTCPVEMVSWDDIQSFLKKLNAKTGKQYRLPTEAEWEFACYGGNQTDYCGSNNIDSVAWYGIAGKAGGNSNQTTHPVGQKQPNGYGIYDMSGNITEWVSDCYNGNCTRHVLRGGSWCNDSYEDSTFQEGLRPDFRGNCVGFRVARTLP
jgi:ankyrin repeat protein